MGEADSHRTEVDRRSAVVGRAALSSPRQGQVVIDESGVASGVLSRGVMARTTARSTSRRPMQRGVGGEGGDHAPGTVRHRAPQIAVRRSGHTNGSWRPSQVYFAAATFADTDFIPGRSQKRRTSHRRLSRLRSALMASSDVGAGADQQPAERRRRRYIIILMLGAPEWLCRWPRRSARCLSVATQRAADPADRMPCNTGD